MLCLSRGLQGRDIRPRGQNWTVSSQAVGALWEASRHRGCPGLVPQLGSPW